MNELTAKFSQAWFTWSEFMLRVRALEAKKGRRAELSIDDDAGYWVATW